MTMRRGQHIELFLIDGEAGGMTTANVSGWTGHILMGPRTDLKRLLAREESHRNGVYLLLGDDPDAIDNTRCYIGKTEDFSQRFRDHDRKRVWWDRAVLISNQDDSFNEGHWGYLEARLVDIATRAERCSLDDNIQTPRPRKLSEAQISDTEAFLDQVRAILPVLGIHLLKDKVSNPSVPPAVDHLAVPEESPLFSLVVPGRGIDARARVVAGEFIMLEGSRTIGQWRGVAKSETTRRSYEALAARFNKLVADGSIRVDGNVGVLTRDIAFTSPSAAGSIATGRSCNGRTAWTWDGGDYAHWEDRGLDES